MAKGSQSSNTALFTVDEDGDGEFAGTLSTTGGLIVDATTETNIEAAIDTLSNLTTTGALNSGSIASGFGNINIGASTFTTTGAANFGTLTLTGNASLQNASTTNITIANRLYDSNNSAGTTGFVLQTTGSGTQWVATSSLGFASASSSHDAVTLAGALDYITLSGQQITRNAVMPVRKEYDVDADFLARHAFNRKLSAVDLRADRLNNSTFLSFVCIEAHNSF